MAPLGRQFQQLAFPGTGYGEMRPVRRPEPARANIEPDSDYVDEVAEAHSRTNLRHDHGVEDLQRAATEGRPSINAPDHAVEGIVRDRRFKSQFESGKSGGTYDPFMRAEAEEKMFGYPHDLPAHERPVYGHMGEPHDMGPTGMYGDTKFVLRPEVTGRTTMTHTDSLGSGMVPIHHADAAAGNVDPQIHSYLGDRSRGSGMDFVEAQIHGGVGLHDVSHADISTEGGYRHDPHRVARMLGEAGVPWRAVHEERWIQPRLGASEDDHYHRSSAFWQEGDFSSELPTISRRQFTLAASPGFRSAYGTESGKFQEGVGPLGHKTYRDIGLANLRQRAAEFRGSSAPTADD